MRARPRAAASAAELAGRSVGDRVGLVLAQPRVQRRGAQRSSPLPGGRTSSLRASSTTGAIASPGEPGAQERAGQAVRVLGARRRQSAPLRLCGPEAAAAREHERSAGQPEQDEAAAETARQRTPAARAPVAMHALDEGDRAPRAGDGEREGGIVALGQAAVDERRGIGQQHRSPGTHSLDRRERGGRVADDGRGRARAGEATRDTRRDRADARRLGQRREHVRDAERERLPRWAGRARPSRTTLPAPRPRRRICRRPGGSAGARRRRPRVITSGHSTTTVNLGSRSRSRGRSRNRTT